ncbi:MAG: putative Ig domain-containing protein [Candidatus Sulfotelmatobacter sp.]
MTNAQKARPVVDLVIVLACAAGMAACQLGLARTEGQQPETPSSTAAPQDGPSLVIENDSELPDTYPRASYEVRFRAHGGVPVLHWRLEKGTLPQGMKLEDDGLLHGQPERTGEFEFTVSVRDGSKPQQAVQKAFVLRVRSALTLNWKARARVNGNRIEGSVEVSNTTPDNMDLTFIVMAVAENGRATAIGYQHFLLRRGTVGKELPFGETLPHGGYVVHVDAVGEVAPKNLIYREQMQTPSALQVTVGP